MLMENERSQKLLNSPFWVRKLRARHALMDLNNDKYVPKEDFEIYVDKLIRNGALSETLGQSVLERVMRIWAGFGVPDYAKISVDEWVDTAVKVSGMFAHARMHVCMKLVYTCMHACTIEIFYRTLSSLPPPPLSLSYTLYSHARSSKRKHILLCTIHVLTQLMQTKTMRYPSMSWLSSSSPSDQTQPTPRSASTYLTRIKMVSKVALSS